ncbi:hypothetical protein IEQ34_022555 [Dendrobium chrysotoxum]|uniref:Uncharacterized protein n=1 Tax=Dendrobium chrysotoxum TaxID=161865 RepID=A0AAV7FK58_DENCH|nr:hypothetical protein IEQ34_022555 [Dendrobium chrysotoxum]
MKEMFRLIVGAFKNLNECQAVHFQREFQYLKLLQRSDPHLLKTIRLKHSDIVFFSMETIMTLVLEEIEGICAQLLSGLLDGVKIVEKNILHIAKKLAEKVLVNCSLKLISLIWLNYLMAIGSAQQEGEIFHPEKYVAATYGSSKLVMNNGSFHNGNGDSMAAKQNAEFLHHSGKSRVNTEHSLDSGTANPNRMSDISSLKGGGNVSLQLSNNNDHCGVGNKKKVRNNSNEKLPSNGGRNESQRKAKSKIFKKTSTLLAIRSKTKAEDRIEIKGNSLL